MWLCVFTLTDLDWVWESQVLAFGFTASITYLTIKDIEVICGMPHGRVDGWTRGLRIRFFESTFFLSFTKCKFLNRHAFSP